MHMLVHESDLTSIKESLRKAHPDTRPSHRMEAVAKGLGFLTYAALLSSLKIGALSVVVDDQAFCTSLGVAHTSVKGKPVRSLSRGIARAMLRKVLDVHPDLTQRGFDAIWLGSRDDLRKSKEEREILFQERRREAYEDDWSADQFELALIFLSRQKKIKTLNRQIGSYSLKHGAENLSRSFGLFTHLGNYVSNGMFLAAAYATGFTVRRVTFDSYNAYLNISMQTVKAARGWERSSQDESRNTVIGMYTSDCARRAA